MPISAASRSDPPRAYARLSRRLQANCVDVVVAFHTPLAGIAFATWFGGPLAGPLAVLWLGPAGRLPGARG